MASAEVNKRALEIVDDAHGLTESELATYLESVCGDNSLLRREVLCYLEYDVEQTVIIGGTDNVTAPKIPDTTTSETRYELGDEIARGGMGVVLRAFDNNIRRDVAVKVLKEAAAIQPDSVRRFLQEAQIGGQLQHPGIAPVYEIGRLHDGRPFIAMKLVKGATLAELLARRREPADDLPRFLNIFEHVCQAIAFAHRRGVIHRDLKPANVMVGEFGEVQVMDWGIAKVMQDDESILRTGSTDVVFQTADAASADSIDGSTKPPESVTANTDRIAQQTRVGQIMGTPTYMAPEQAIGRADRRSDVYSLGLILYEILTGKTAAGKLDSIRQELDGCGCDRELLELVQECTQPNQADRPEDAGVVATRISDYSNAIQRRLKEAEVSTARAEMRATEERRRRQRSLWTIAIVAMLLLVAAVIGAHIRNKFIERESLTRAKGLVQSLLLAKSERVPGIVEDMDAYRTWTDPLLNKSFDEAEHGSTDRLHAGLALLPVDDTKLAYLSDQLHQVSPNQFLVLRAALMPHREKITDKLWQFAQDEQQNAASRFQTAAALAAFSPNDAGWKELAPFVAGHLITDVLTVEFGRSLQHFETAGHQLVEALASFHEDRSLPEKQRGAAAEALAGLCQQNPVQLIQSILHADTAVDFQPLLAALKPHSAAVKEQLVSEMLASPPDQQTIEQRDTNWTRQSLAAVTLVHLGHGDEVWPMLKLTPDPSLRSLIINNFGKLETDHNTLAARLAMRLTVEQEVSIRRALIQSLGGLNSKRLPTAERKRFTGLLQESYAADADPGIHGSASWTLRQWGETLPELLTSEPATSDEQADNRVRRWFVNSQGQTMVVFPKSAKDKDRQIESFTISTHEVTIAEFLRFRKGHELHSKFTVTEDYPAHNVNWYLAAEYCNWLSKQEGLPEEQWVYEGNKDDHGTLTSKKNFRELGGYRLPTDAEWEYACRAGASGSYGFGEPTSLLGRYAHYDSRRRSDAVESLLPNDAGLFDMHGNLSEWTHDAEVPYDAKSAMGRRIMRGGDFLSGPSRVQSIAGLIVSPKTAGITVGFRVARTHR